MLLYNFLYQPSHFSKLEKASNFKKQKNISQTLPKFSNDMVLGKIVLGNTQEMRGRTSVSIFQGIKPTLKIKNKIKTSLFKWFKKIKAKIKKFLFKWFKKLSQQFKTINSSYQIIRFFVLL
jgi:hypothetical protein